ncbi:unnamed protein product, partial [marine sediment metagenome]
MHKCSKANKGAQGHELTHGQIEDTGGLIDKHKEGR